MEIKIDKEKINKLDKEITDKVVRIVDMFEKDNLPHDATTLIALIHVAAEVAVYINTPLAQYIGIVVKEHENAIKRQLDKQLENILSAMVLADTPTNKNSAN